MEAIIICRIYKRYIQILLGFLSIIYTESPAYVIVVVVVVAGVVAVVVAVSVAVGLLSP